MKALLRIRFYLSGKLKIAARGTALSLLYALIRPAAESVLRVSDGFPSVIMAAFVFGIDALFVSAAESGSRWQEYAKTLPYSDGQLVDSAYLFSLLYAAFAAVPAAAVLPVLLLRNPALLSGSPDTSAAEAALMFAVTAAAAVLQISAFLYQVFYRRNSSLKSFGVFAAFLVLLLLPYLLYVPVKAADGQTTAFLKNTQKLPLWMLADAAVCYPLSWLLSRRLYCRRGRKKVTA
ncbi:MAG: ABC-2 transporter permease [Oscillospiraceae bacterium]|nr:ABC-2 transporter permease [Oscillospiraceae bacterium]